MRRKPTRSLIRLFLRAQRSCAALAPSVGALLFATLLVASAEAAPWRFILPEQRCLSVRQPGRLPRVALPDSEAPPTVADPRFEAPAFSCSLDEAIRICLANAEVVRFLAGATAASSGRTIYDVAIANTAIDQQQGRFDPVLSVNNAWNRVETPQAFPDPGDPSQTLIDGIRTDGYGLDAALTKTTRSGGALGLGVASNDSRFQPGLFSLNPQNRTLLDLSVTQPLLQGGGFAANRAPIVLARIDVERSYFQFKDSLQEMVRGVIEGYWSLVAARTDLWAREQQVKQGEFALDLALAQVRHGIVSRADEAQSRLALANFRAAVVTAKASVLQRESALQNLLGLPPAIATRLTPVSPPATQRYAAQWEELVELAEVYRPDLIELKLILEADQQALLVARNQAHPRLDAVGLYRWNGLEGQMPSGERVGSSLGQATDWSMGVNFSVPLGLRQARAQLRQSELLIARDRANLQQGLHAAIHLVALSVRNLNQFYEQYLAFRETRIAATTNLDAQFARYKTQQTQLLNALQAIADWGNALSSEAQALAQYNSELSNLERQTGTLLESHGIRLFEERYASLGPLGYLGKAACYPRDVRPGDNLDVYPTSDEPAEKSFDLRSPLDVLQKNKQLEIEDLPPLPDDDEYELQQPTSVKRS